MIEVVPQRHSVVYNRIENKEICLFGAGSHYDIKSFFLTISYLYRINLITRFLWVYYLDAR